MTKTANTSADGSQRKRNTTSSRPTVASQQTNNKGNYQQQKKGSKETSQQNNAQPSTPTPASKPASPPTPQPEKHVPLKGFNGDEIDNLLSRGVDPHAEEYKPEKPVTQKTGPWGQKRKLYFPPTDYQDPDEKQLELWRQERTSGLSFESK